MKSKITLLEEKNTNEKQMTMNIKYRVMFVESSILSLFLHFKIGSTAAKSDLRLNFCPSGMSFSVEIDDAVFEVEAETKASISYLSMMRRELIDHSLLEPLHITSVFLINSLLPAAKVTTSNA